MSDAFCCIYAFSDVVDLEVAFDRLVHVVDDAGSGADDVPVGDVVIELSVVFHHLVDAVLRAVPLPERDDRGLERLDAERHDDVAAAVGEFVPEFEGDERRLFRSLRRGHLAEQFSEHVEVFFGDAFADAVDDHEFREFADLEDGADRLLGEGDAFVFHECGQSVDVAGDN